jgi:serine/threonine protein kinase
MIWGLLSPGLRQVGRYEVLGRLGKGGGGVVYKARHRDTGMVVAIKVLSSQMAKDRVLLKRFEQEFLATRQLDDPHVVQGLDFGQEGETFFLAMEFVAGQNLWDLVKSRGRLTETEAIAIGVAIGQALEAAHRRGMIHRDVKPDNVLVGPDGQAKLADFGVVKNLRGPVNLTMVDSTLGTPNFMAPEQFQGSKHADARSDVYGLAATLYMAVTGEVPFRSQGFMGLVRKKLTGDILRPGFLVPELSERVERAILRALSPNPSHRPASCAEFIAELTGDFRVRTPQERRGAVRYPCGLEGFFQPVSGERRIRWKARVEDISAGGVCLGSSRRFEPGTVLLLNLRDAERALSGTLLGRVVHVEPQAERPWFLGCQFSSQLAEDDIRNLL